MPAGVAVLAVVIIFQDPGADLARPFQQGQPPGQAQRHATWKVAGWRQEDQARLRSARAMPTPPPPAPVAWSNSPAGEYSPNAILFPPQQSPLSAMLDTDHPARRSRLPA